MTLLYVRSDMLETMDDVFQQDAALAKKLQREEEMRHAALLEEHADLVERLDNWKKRALQESQEQSQEEDNRTVTKPIHSGNDPIDEMLRCPQDNMRAPVCSLERCDSLEESVTMLSTHFGRACLFVQEVLRRVEFFKSTDPGIDSSFDAVARDDMVFLAEKTFVMQEHFRLAGKPTRVDLGYHYTNEASLESIKSNGLMSKRERDQSSISVSRNNGASYGDGVYTANNMFAFRKFGSVGLLVARLQGKTQRIIGKVGDRVEVGHDVDTLIGNKRRVRNEAADTPALDADNYDEVVLYRSSQCLPLLRFHRSVVGSDGTHAIEPESIMHVQTFQEELDKVVGMFFNGKAISTDIVSDGTTCDTRRISNRAENPGIVEALRIADDRRLATESQEQDKIISFCGTR